MKLKSLALPVLFALCLGVAGYIVFAKTKSKPARGQMGFTLKITQTIYRSDGSAPTRGYDKTRYYKADGSWKNVTNYAGGRVAIAYAQPGRGVFELDDNDQKLVYVGGSSGQVMTEEFWRNNPGFVGEETILGYKTFHIHQVEANGQSIDTYFCPALQGNSLKTITISSKGSRTVTEVTQVTLGEPSFEHIPNYPVDKSRFEEIHKN